MMIQEIKKFLHEKKIVIAAKKIYFRQPMWFSDVFAIAQINFGLNLKG
jgi:hypothetical protein